MSNIDLDREENTFWPWVVGLVLLALVVWVAAEVSGESEPSVPEPTVTVAPVTRPGGAALQAWVRDSAEAQERSGDGSSYTVAGLRRLTAALQLLAAQSAEPTLRQRATELVTATARLDSIADPAARVSAARAAFIEAADVVEAAHAGVDTLPAVPRLLAEARAAAQTLDDALPLEEQRHRVFSFFDHISEAVRVAEEARSPR